LSQADTSNVMTSHGLVANRNVSNK